MTSLTRDDVSLYESQKVCHICKKGFFYGKNRKKNLLCTETLEVIIQKNLKGQPITFASQITKYPKKLL